MKHLAPTGIMAGHDWTVGFPGVAQAVKEVCDEAGIMPRVVQGATVWFFPMSEYLEGMQKKNQVAVAKPHRNSKPKKGKKRGRRTVATT